MRRPPELPVIRRSSKRYRGQMGHPSIPGLGVDRWGSYAACPLVPKHGSRRDLPPGRTAATIASRPGVSEDSELGKVGVVSMEHLEEVPV